MLIDTHCHLNIEEAFPDVAAELSVAEEAGVEALVVIGIDLPSSRLAIDIAERYDSVYATAGVHPTQAHTYEPSQLQELEQMLMHPKVVALGEVGFDYYWDSSTKEEQQRCLHDQLELARSGNKAVVFHCREAYDDLLRVLERVRPERYVLHCFSGTAEQAVKAQNMGAFLGVDGPITFPKASELRKVVCGFDRDRVVVETDSPYLAPVPFRGQPNRPAYVKLVNEALAEVWQVSAREAAEITTTNAKALYGI